MWSYNSTRIDAPEPVLAGTRLTLGFVGRGEEKPSPQVGMDAEILGAFSSGNQNSTLAKCSKVAFKAAMGMRSGISLEEAFEAILDGDVFRDVLRSYARRIGAKGFGAGWSGDSRAIDDIFAYENEWTPEMVTAYASSFAQNDPWTRAIAPTGDANNTFIDVSDYVSPQDWERSELYNELLRPNGDDTFWALATAIPFPGGLGGVTFYRGRTQRQFSDRELAILQTDAGDIARLVGLRAAFVRRTAEATCWRSLVDRFASEAFVIDRNLRLLATNALGEKMLRERAGLFASRGYLHACRPAAQRALEAAAAKVAIGRARDAEVVTLGSGHAARRFQMLRVESEGALHRLILLGDVPASLDARVESTLRATYRLSPAEAELIRRLASGENTGEIAESRQVRVDTIRTQYRSAMAKMNAERLIDAILAVRRITHFT